MNFLVNQYEIIMSLRLNVLCVNDSDLVTNALIMHEIVDTVTDRTKFPYFIIFIQQDKSAKVKRELYTAKLKRKLSC